jgi:NAD(P)-dependent dehydrogenase (short-subunit alcohol dehydrogenase family)
MGLQGKRAVVTGGGSGIGAGIAERLRMVGAEVVTVDADASTEPTEVADLGEDGGALAERLVDTYGPFDLIVNNVGVTPRSGFLELDEAEWDRVFAVNLRGPWFFTKRLVEALIDDGRGGSILFVSSLHDTSVSGKPHYSASKAAIAMLVKELGWSLASHGIRVNAVAPGGISTGNDLAPDREYPRIAMRRIGLPDDVARVAVALLDDDVSGYVTGSRVPVDGGLALFDWLHDADNAPPR